MSLPKIGNRGQGSVVVLGGTEFRIVDKPSGIIEVDPRAGALSMVESA